MTHRRKRARGRALGAIGLERWWDWWEQTESAARFIADRNAIMHSRDHCNLAVRISEVSKYAASARRVLHGRAPAVAGYVWAMPGAGVSFGRRRHRIRTGIARTIVTARLRLERRSKDGHEGRDDQQNAHKVR